MFSIQFKPIVQEIIENTIQTCLDQWVLSIATFVQTYWMTQSLDNHLDYDLESFKEAIADLKRIRKRETYYFYSYNETNFINKF